MFGIIYGLVEKCKNKKNNKVLICVIYISKFYDWFFFIFFFIFLKYILCFWFFIVDLRIMKGLCVIFKWKLVLVIFWVLVIFGYVRVDDYLVKLDLIWIICMKYY